MNLTSNFDYCAELGLGPLKAIFHLALKNEELFPHNIGPFPRNYAGESVSVSVRLIDDDDSPADLSIADDKHIAFNLPIEITALIPDAPDPSLSQVTLRATVVAPGALATWTGDDGEPVLGIDFTGIAPADVSVPSVDGLPQLDASRFEAAIHTRYDTIPHSYALAGNTLNIYDGSRDATLSPPNGPGNPAITATLDPPGPNRFLNVSLPLHADVPSAFSFSEYGTAAFSRPVTEDDGSVSVDMAAPDDPGRPTAITFVGGHPAESAVKAQLTPLLVQRLAAFGKITEPWFTEPFAKTVLAQEAASYLAGRKYPMYTPKSGDPDHPVTTPVGLLLPADGVLAILMTLRTGTVDDATAPDNFLGADELALAVGRAKLDETIQKAIRDAFPGIENGSSEMHTKHGDATLHSLNVTPSNPGDHGQAEGHLWTSGEAEVHIPCWPDPDVSFDGPIFLRMKVTETDTDCSAEIQPEMGDFDAGESCCDVFVDLIIPIVGWIMLAVVEDTIDKVGGQLASDYADKQATEIQAIPPVVVGVAELQSCLEGLNVSTDGLVFPGKLRIRRDGTSFEDLAASGELPRP